jgi:hypothetical protein
VSATVAAALLRQLQTTFRVRVVQEQYLDTNTDCQIWKLTATSATGDVWTARHEDHCKAACGLAG